jgi:hypothetical protein
MIEPISKQDLNLFVKIMNERNKGNFHKLNELEPRIFKSKYNKKYPSLKGQVVYYEVGETNEEFFYVREYILRVLRIDKTIGWSLK